MKIVIIEDEPLVAKDLERLIAVVEKQSEIAQVLTSVAGAKEWLQHNKAPDLIFSDIRLSDGISFEIFETLHVRCPIIFTTAYDEYAIRAFKLNSIDYLLKPVDKHELELALQKYKSVSVEGLLAEQLKGMVNRWNDTSKRYKERFLSLHRNALVPITDAEVAYFHKDELIHLHTLNGEKYISEHQTLDEIESLVDPQKFFRVNRQYLIHLQTVGRIKTTHKGLTVELRTAPPLEIDISREKAVAFKSWVA